MAKRRSNGEGTIWYAEKEARYRAQYPDAEGRRRTLTGKTRKEVEKQLRIALTKRDSNTLEEMTSVAGTVEELLLGFLQSVEGKREPKTVDRYSLDVKRYLIPQIGKLRLSQLTSEVIEVAYSEIQKQHSLSDKKCDC